MLFWWGLRMKKVLNYIADQVILLAELVRKQIRRLEKKMYGFGLPALMGLPILILGVLASAAGVFMLVVPGPGMVTIAFGIAVTRIGFNILTRNTAKAG